MPTHFATGDTKKPDYLAINPNGHIPTLVDDGVVYWESMAINLYLARKYDKGLQPRSVEDECHAIQWSIWAMTEMENPLLDVLMHRMFLPAEQRDPKAADAGVAKLQAPLAVLDGHLVGRKHILGDQYSVADVNVASVLSWATLVGVDLSTFPNLARWLSDCSSRPAAKMASAKAMG
ncbi:MAG: glutathione S-transferase family protein [Candidatus Binatia bacterium]